MMSMHAPLATTRSGSCPAILTRWPWWSGCNACCVDVIKDEFERLGILDINAVQALLLFNIGEHEVTAGELKTAATTEGSNVS